VTSAELEGTLHRRFDSVAVADETERWPFGIAITGQTAVWSTASTVCSGETTCP